VSELQAEQQRRDNEARRRLDEIQRREDEYQQRHDQMIQKYDVVRRRYDESLRGLSSLLNLRAFLPLRRIRAEMQEVRAIDEEEMRAIEEESVLLREKRLRAQEAIKQGSLAEPPIVQVLARYTALAPIVAWVRSIVEFVVPLLVGIGAIVVLLTT
jgi:hypothetical protein